MEVITKSTEVNGYLIEIRAQHEVYKVFMAKYGSLIRENYYRSEKQANGCFYRFKKQANNY